MAKSKKEKTAVTVFEDFEKFSKRNTSTAIFCEVALKTINELILLDDGTFDGHNYNYVEKVMSIYRDRIK